MMLCIVLENDLENVESLLLLMCIVWRQLVCICVCICFLGDNVVDDHGHIFIFECDTCFLGNKTIQLALVTTNTCV